MLDKYLQRLDTNFDIETYRNISTVTHKGHKTNRQLIPCIFIVKFWQVQFQILGYRIGCSSIILD